MLSELFYFLWCDGGRRYRFSTLRFILSFRGIWVCLNIDLNGGLMMDGISWVACVELGFVVCGDDGRRYRFSILQYPVDLWNICLIYLCQITDVIVLKAGVISLL